MAPTRRNFDGKFAGGLFTHGDKLKTTRIGQLILIGYTLSNSPTQTGIIIMEIITSYYLLGTLQRARFNYN